ncbi:DNA/RNA non-specific endonuclease [Nocardia sp. NPDC050408]|uniref:DNA/RNA non-specific endonuclease n=1 Tax=Nocardia sp. NPDC050408 TaxID=3364319 RepID=UPI0037B7C24C
MSHRIVSVFVALLLMVGLVSGAVGSQTAVAAPARVGPGSPCYPIQEAIDANEAARQQHNASPPDQNNPAAVEAYNAEAEAGQAQAAQLESQMEACLAGNPQANPSPRPPRGTNPQNPGTITSDSDPGRLNQLNPSITRTRTTEDGGQSTYSPAIRTQDGNWTATNASAYVTPGQLGTGSPASSAIRPPGFRGGAGGDARAHLLGDQLGGLGNDPRNIVTLTQKTNRLMSEAENDIANLVRGGDNVFVNVTPIGFPGSRPEGILLVSRSDSGIWYIKYFPD